MLLAKKERGKICWILELVGELVRATIAAMNAITTETWGGKGLFCLCFHNTVPHQRDSGQEL